MVVPDQRTIPSAARKASPPLTETNNRAMREVAVPNREGLHARPVMRFIRVADQFAASVFVTNLTRRQETVDGKSAMQMLLLEATQNCVLRIEAQGPDAAAAVDALASLVASGFKADESE